MERPKLSWNRPSTNFCGESKCYRMKNAVPILMWELFQNVRFFFLESLIWKDFFHLSFSLLHSIVPNLIFSWDGDSFSVRAMKFMVERPVFVILAQLDVHWNRTYCNCGGNFSYWKIKCLKLIVQHWPLRRCSKLPDTLTDLVII